MAKDLRDMSDMVGDLHWMAAKAVEDLIKKDARIAELEAQYQRDVFGLNNEGDPIGGDPAGGYANDTARLRSELAAIKAQEPVAWEVYYADDDSFHTITRNKMLIDGYSSMAYVIKPLYAAPVSEAKAQGVVMDGSQLAGLLEQVRLNDDEAKPHGSGATYWNNAVIACQVAIRDALDAPVQQVSVPDGWRLMPPKLTAEMERELNRSYGGWGTLYQVILDSAPAAPAADAGLVEALDYQVLFDAIAAATSVYANGAINISVQAFRAALAAHRAKGVV